MTTEPPTGDPVSDAFFSALAGLGPVDLRVMHLAMNRVASLEANGQGGEADILLLRLLRIIEDG